MSDNELISTPCYPLEFMKYHAPTKQFTVTTDSLESASRNLLWAIKSLREASGLSVKGYEHTGRMEPPQFAEAAILDAAKALGINLGANRYGKLDVSQSG